MALENPARCRRIGGVLSALAVGALVMFLPAATSLTMDWRTMLIVAIELVLLVTGVGLLTQTSWSRYAGTGVFLLLAGVAGWQFAKQWNAALPRLQINTDVVFALANAAATTGLLLWLCVRASLTLLDRGHPRARVTAFVVGLVFALIAAFHLRLALSGEPAFGAQLSFSTNGTFLIGFPGWPFWHGVLLLGSLGLMLGGKAVRRGAALLLAAAFAVVGPLAMWHMHDAGFAPLSAMTVVLGAMPLGIAYLFVWLWQELKPLVPSTKLAK